MMQFEIGMQRKALVLLCCFLLTSFMVILNLSTFNFLYSPSLISGNTTNASDPSLYDPTFDTIFNGPSVNPCELVILRNECCQVFIM